jgi:hypothetical protein
MTTWSSEFSSQPAHRKDNNDLMPEQKQEEQWRRADKEARKRLPPGVKLVRTLMLCLPPERNQRKFLVVGTLAQT